MLVQYETTTHKSEPAVLVGKASTSKAKGKGARRWKRKKDKGTAVTATASTGGAPPAALIGKDKEKVLQRSRRLSKDEMILRLGDGKAVAAEVVGSLRLRMEFSLFSWDVNGVAERRNQTLLDMVRSMMSFTELPPSFWGYALETVAKLLNIAPSKSVPQTPYEIWHAKPASYKYLRVWGSPAYVKRLVGDKLDSRSSLCRFIGYPKKKGYYFYDSAEQKIFVSRNVVFLEKDFPSDSRHDEVLIEESSGVMTTTSFDPTVHTDGVRSTRESWVLERYGFVWLTSQLDTI
ncbi:UNVERIFIED_CONTAM: hypothetical protein Sradi_3149100 [Sesamum radiatum]|uniref:Retroviral polymerase SH3-like domain-containing protein n=1 Tax=Sesamum radiatum TaxID=300843 RepID=A0AAW2RFS5_SESRA